MKTKFTSSVLTLHQQRFIVAPKKTKHETKKQCPEHEQKIGELTDTLQRLQAEFDNYRKRIDQDSELLRKRASENIIKDLLPIIDDFERALHQKDHTPFAHGIELVYARVIQLLEDKGVKAIETNGVFDPTVHEAL